MNIINYDSFCNQKQLQLKPLPHQIQVAEHLLKPEVRGLIIFHGIGSGKTLTALLSIREILAAEPETYKTIYLIMPEVIQKNFIFEIDKFGHEEIIRRLKKIDYIKHPEDFTIPSFEGAIVVFDEVHLFNNEILSKNQTALDIFNRIKGTESIKILSMSGTPIYNTPFDASLLVNMVSKEDIFTRDGYEFERRYTNPFTYKLYRVGEFREKFRGYVSYFEGFTGTILVPMNRGLEILYAPMSQEHTRAVMRSKEPDQDIVAMKEKDHNSKFHILLTKLNELKNEIGSIFIYCKYAEINLLLSKFLSENGYTNWKDIDRITAKQTVFANLLPSNFNTLIPIFNEPGNKIKIIIGDENIAAGITLLNCRYCFILNIPEFYGQLEQIQGRILRLCSHKGLKEKDRTVLFFLIFGVYFGEDTSPDFIKFDNIKTYNTIIRDTIQYIKEASI